MPPEKPPELSCLSFDRLPTNEDILGLAPKNRKWTEKFGIIYECLVIVYEKLQIPLLTRFCVKERYYRLEKNKESHKKKPILDYNDTMKDLFHVAKCACYLKSDACHCDQQHEIPTHVLEFYLDQIDARRYSLDCNCLDNHRIVFLLDGKRTPLFDRGSAEQTSHCSPSTPLNLSTCPEPTNLEVNFFHATDHNNK